MRKIPTLFERDHSKPGSPVTDVVNPACAWVFDEAENVTVRLKVDGTCTMLDESGDWWARREVKPGKAAPPNYVVVEHDDVTGKTFGWQPIDDSPFVKFFKEARAAGDVGAPGTYELVGPKIQGNPLHLERHILIAHDVEAANQTETFGWDATCTTDDVRNAVQALGRAGHEGLVFTHIDGRRAKIKARDFPTTTEES